VNVGPMPEPGETRPNAPAADPEALAKALEVELILKRASWQKAQARRGTWRALSFLFLLLVIVGALFAWFYFASTLNHRGEDTPRAGAADAGR
jgi:hypothetical protein